MAAVKTVDLSGLGAALARAGQAPADYRGLMRQYGVFLSAEAKKCFDQQRDPDGRPWAPLVRARSRKRDKRAKKKGGVQRVLRDTGLLMASVGSNGGGHVEQITPTSLLFGTSVAYSGYHQSGTRRMVARPFLGVSAKAADLMAQMAADFVRRRMVEG